MHDYLVFCLCAPMASFGTYAGHERRGSDRVPSRSAMLGLIGAALGVARTDTVGQGALRRYRVALQPLTESAPMRDYHTVQTVPQTIKRPASRRAAIEAAGRAINTTITVRDYRTDVAVAVAMWGEEEAWPLTQLADALRTPEYVLYAGRKSCPVSAPLAPGIVRAPDPPAAVCAVAVPDWLPRPVRGPITCDPFGGGVPDRIEFGPVEPIDRTLWHFAQSEIWHFDRAATS
ncbi:type I-E CRISPR-associated protein Cas5/CasD [Candidatus Rariloculus sp.]|uniref:type I-E CRISPR-associated protein Cas5/CasD n=1 Tax=Candidatus Rariloculus sp. TaxID=3101265 RepID=UPI003D100944